MTYSITLEHGSDDSYLAWVHELPGCFACGATRGAAIANASHAVARFREWLRESGEPVEDDDVTIVVADEIESLIEADEDTEVLLATDREPLSPEDWRNLERWLTHSREALLRRLAALPDEQLEQQARG